MPSDGSRRFIVQRFARHYKEANLRMPERFSRREFGFMFFDRNFMMRHLGFPTRAALKNYLVENAPSHAYHSSAYYEKPDAPTMKEKNWLGADLIFDLDADHVRGAEGLSYEDMLSRVKEEAIRLIDEFLLGDLGFGEEDLRIVFSGGRGYHVHIGSTRVLKLNSHERREIVDYVTGTDLDLDWVFPMQAFEQGRYKDRTSVAHRRAMPKRADGGWRGRIRKGIDDLLDELEAMSEEDAKALVTDALKASKKDIGRKSVDGMYADLFKRTRGGTGADRIRKEDTFEVFSEKRHGDAFLEVVELRVKGAVRGETDEPVTSDVKRLIRLPSSLHGKTGFEVVPLSRAALDPFDPFVDAVPSAFGDDEVGVVCEKPVEITMKGQNLKLTEGENRVPEYAAVFLLCRRLAIIDN